MSVSIQYWKNCIFPNSGTLFFDIFKTSLHVEKYFQSMHWYMEVSSKAFKWINLLHNYCKINDQPMLPISVVL